MDGGIEGWSDGVTVGGLVAGTRAPGPKFQTATAMPIWISSAAMSGRRFSNAHAGRLMREVARLPDLFRPACFR
jgi:hypothetical protein